MIKFKVFQPQMRYITKPVIYDKLIHMHSLYYSNKNTLKKYRFAAGSRIKWLVIYKSVGLDIIVPPIYI